MKWEYCIVSLGTGSQSVMEAVAAKLNELGEQQWELVAVAPSTTFGQTTSLAYVFKRPKGQA